jgi:hypothetical protein
VAVVGHAVPASQFESTAFTFYAERPRRRLPFTSKPERSRAEILEAALGIEPRVRVLQTLALPLGDAANKLQKKVK